MNSVTAPPSIGFRLDPPWELAVPRVGSAVARIFRLVARLTPPVMRKLIIVTLITTFFYAMTGLVFFEGSFAGALVVKPYPTYQVAFGGGEEGIWARYHPGQPPPWFMQQDLKVISSFDWEQGRSVWIDAYLWGYLAMLLAWVVLAPICAVHLIIRIRARFYSPPLSIR